MRHPDYVAQKSFSFDPTINLGHILTFLSLVIAMSVGFASMNTRLTVLEEARVNQVSRDAVQDALIKERIAELMVVVSKVDSRTERIIDRLEERRK